MSEENNDGAPQGSGSSQQQSPGLSQSARDTLSAMDGLEGAEELREGLNSLGQSQQQQPGQQQGNQGEGSKQPNPDDDKEVINDLLSQQGAENGGSEEEKDDNGGGDQGGSSNSNGEENTEEEEGKEKSSLKVTSPIFGDNGYDFGKNENDDKGGGITSFETSKEVSSFVKEKTGYDSITDLVNNFSDLKKQSEEHGAVKQQLDSLQKLFSEMPSELYQTIDAFTKGEDWKSVITSRPNIDFTKDIDQQSAKDLVQNYYPGQFSEAEWEDYNSEEPDQGVKKAIDIAILNAKASFSNDKKGIDSYKQDQINKATAFNQKLSESLNESVKYLQDNFDGISDGFVKGIKNELTIANLNKAFVNEDGTFTKEAALRYTMAMHGDSLIKQLREIASHQAETKERQEILDRTPERKKVQTSKEEKGQISSEVQKRLDDITKLNTKSRY